MSAAVRVESQFGVAGRRTEQKTERCGDEYYEDECGWVGVGSSGHQRRRDDDDEVRDPRLVEPARVELQKRAGG